jgi:hypothetical protein
MKTKLFLDLEIRKVLVKTKVGLQVVGGMSRDKHNMGGEMKVQILVENGTNGHVLKLWFLTAMGG